MSVSFIVHMNTRLLEAHIRIAELRNLQSHGWRGRCQKLLPAVLRCTTVGASGNSTDSCLLLKYIRSDLSHLTGFSNSESHRPSFSSFRIAVQLVQQKLLQDAWRVSGLLKWSRRGPYQLCWLYIEPKMVDLGYFEHIFVTHVLFLIILNSLQRLPCHMGTIQI